MKRQLRQIAVLLSLVLILSACGGGGNKATINVTLVDYAFQPNQFTVPAGANVTLNAKNTGSTEHEFVIMEKGYTVQPPFGDKDESHIFWELDGIEAGTSKTGTFTAPTEPGDYEVVCGLQGHIEQGMVGTLTVK
jgi:uncharacterized cupredoxin-like copper-binding protein